MRTCKRFDINDGDLITVNSRRGQLMFMQESGMLKPGQVLSILTRSRQRIYSPTPTLMHLPKYQNLNSVR